MKLIIERIDGVNYAYMERGRHFRSNEKIRRKANKSIKHETLNHDCCLENLPDNCHLVFELKKAAKK